MILMKDRSFLKFILRLSKYGQPPTPQRKGCIIDTVTEMSIYAFSSTYPRLGIQTTLSPARSSISSGDSDAFLGQIRYAILPASSDSTPRSPLSWPELCSKESRRHQNQITQPTQLAPFRIGTQSCSGYSATCISLSFCHFPELMTMGEGWNFHLALYSDQNLWARSQHILTPFASGSN